LIFPARIPPITKMISGIRLVTHLRPPSGVVRIEFHRFSPYHRDPDQFGLELRPSPKYEDLYPFAAGDIARIAYLFEACGNRPPPPYLDILVERLQDWQASFDEHDCTLTWEPDGVDVVVTDRRPSFAASRIRLRQHAAQVFRSLDRPKSVGLLVSEARSAAQCESASTLLALTFADPALEEADSCIAFTAADFMADPASHLKVLASAGLTFAEGDKLLALPVRKGFAPSDLGWLSTGI
jgi:hypothetical protein